MAPPVRGRSFADGALVVDKPAGPTSHDIVAVVRRIAGGKVGHTGTLDPLATGVLPLLVGRATRLAQFLTDAHKVYEAGIRFGWATDTGDAAGRPLGPEVDALPSTDRLDGCVGALPWQLRSASARVLGQARRRPPVVTIRAGRSRIGARAGSCDGARARSGWLDASVATLRVSCSAGFYVRSLAQDLGEVLGCGAHLATLRRLASGRFTLDQAIGLERALTDRDAALAAVVPMADILPDLPAVQITEHDVERVRRGLDLRVQGAADHGIRRRGSRVRLLAPDGSLTAIATWNESAGTEAGALHPAVVLG